MLKKALLLYAAWWLWSQKADGYGGIKPPTVRDWPGRPGCKQTVNSAGIVIGGSCQGKRGTSSAPPADPLEEAASGLAAEAYRKLKQEVSEAIGITTGKKTQPEKLNTVPAKMVTDVYRKNTGLYSIAARLS